MTMNDWRWFGSAAHFIAGRFCRFHLATLVANNYLVSTVGEYVHPRHSAGSEKAEIEWMRDNWPGEDVGYGRKYETMVFAWDGEECNCGCGLPLHDGNSIDFRGYNTASAATTGHMEMCHKWAANSDQDAQ